MKALLQSVIVSLSLMSSAVLANELPQPTEIVADTDIKTLQEEAMQQIEQELMESLPADIAKHQQLINEHIFDQRPLKETVQQNGDDIYLDQKKDDRRLINFLLINTNSGAQS